MINELLSQRSSEWNKPKEKNLRKDNNGKIVDSRIPRDYKKIKELHNQINSLKPK